MWRRVIAALSALALFFLTTQAASAECRMPERWSQAGSTPHVHQVGAKQGVAQAAHHHDEGRSPSSDRAPNASHPCTALSSCVVTLSTVAATHLLGVTDVDVQRAETTPRVLTSVVIAPELPPPRA